MDLVYSSFLTHVISDPTFHIRKFHPLQMSQVPQHQSICFAPNQHQRVCVTVTPLQYIADGGEVPLNTELFLGGILGGAAGSAIGGLFGRDGRAVGSQVGTVLGILSPI